MTIKKPMGMVLKEGPGGEVVVESIVEGGHTDEDGTIQVPVQSLLSVTSASRLSWVYRQAGTTAGFSEPAALASGFSQSCGFTPPSFQAFHSTKVPQRA